MWDPQRLQRRHRALRDTLFLLQNLPSVDLVLTREYSGRRRVPHDHVQGFIPFAFVYFEEMFFFSAGGWVVGAFFEWVDVGLMVICGGVWGWCFAF